MQNLMCSGRVMAGIAFAVLVGFGSVAHAGTMGNGARQRNQVYVNKCLAMPHDKMMADQSCKVLMKVHPEMFPAGTVTPSGTAHP